MMLGWKCQVDTSGDKTAFGLNHYSAIRPEAQINSGCIKKEKNIDWQKRDSAKAKTCMLIKSY